MLLLLLLLNRGWSGTRVDDGEIRREPMKDRKGRRKMNSSLKSHTGQRTGHWAVTVIISLMISDQSRVFCVFQGISYGFKQENSMY